MDTYSTPIIQLAIVFAIVTIEKTAQVKVVEAQYLLTQLYANDDPIFSAKRNNTLTLGKEAVQQGFLPVVELQKALQEKVKHKKKTA